MIAKSVRHGEEVIKIKTIKLEISAEDAVLIRDALFALDSNRYALRPDLYETERARLHDLWGRLKREAETADWTLRV